MPDNRIGAQIGQRDCLEFRRLAPQYAELLADFFDALRKSGDEPFFHPHPLTTHEARMRCRYNGKDLYYILVSGVTLLGYGMLRGWDEGYEVPSLGIAIHPDFRGKGYARLLMRNLHAAALLHGAKTVRLKVQRDNTTARRLYESLGYQFELTKSEEFIGFRDLGRTFKCQRR
jgi:ribosomal protein S18 acetylase RimI-like enzyme